MSFQFGISRMHYRHFYRVMAMVFNATINNISVILWWSVLLLEETGVPGENHWLAASHWQTLSHNVVSLIESISIRPVVHIEFIVQKILYGLLVVDNLTAQKFIHNWKQWFPYELTYVWQVESMGMWWVVGYRKCLLLTQWSPLVGYYHTIAHVVIDESYNVAGSAAGQVINSFLIFWILWRI